jgi:hypothetical protein
MNFIPLAHGADRLSCAFPGAQRRPDESDMYKGAPATLTNVLRPAQTTT